MKRLHVLVATLITLLPSAHAQDGGGVGTVFDDALTYLCESQGALSPSIGGFDVDVPGVSDLGLDLRPLCQYADIVSKGTGILKDLRTGTMGTTEDLVNETLGTFAETLGAKLGTEEANEAITELDTKLTEALGAGDGFLTAYRDAVNDALGTMRGDAQEQASEAFADAREAMSDPDADIDPDTRLQGDATHLGTQQDIIEQRANQLEQRTQVEALTEASDQLLEQQEENNAYQQVIADTLQVETAPGTSSGIAEQAVKDARSATSVRQSINVLTEAVASQLRNDAVLSGAVIENLQANARQQAITNHQLQVLAGNVLAEEERRVIEEERAITSALQDAQENVATSVEDLKNSIHEVTAITSSEPMKEINFSFCGLFPSSC